MDVHAALEAWMSGRVEPPPIVKFLGVRLVSAADGRAEMELPVRAELYNPMGTLHGGIFADLADAAIGVAIASLADQKEPFTTVDLQVHYFVPVREGTLHAAAAVIRRGRTTAYCECEIHDEKGTLTAKASSTVLFHQRTG